MHRMQPSEVPDPDASGVTSPGEETMAAESAATKQEDEMKPMNYEGATLAFGTVLKDTGVKLYEEAKRLAEQGANEESMLFTRASVLMQDAAKLPHKEFLDSAESIAKGVLFGTAAIAEQKAKAFWSNLIKTSFEFAASLAGGVLDLTGLSAAKPVKKVKKQT